MHDDFEISLQQREIQRFVEQATVASRDGRAALLIRHGHRDTIAAATVAAAFRAPLTDRGRRESRALGALLPKTGEIRLTFSPVPRCEETARQITFGVEEARGTSHLMGPRDNLAASFILEPRAAVAAFAELGLRGFMVSWFEGVLDPTMIHEASRARNGLLQSLLQSLASEPTPGLDIHVTHDIVVAAILGAAWDIADESIPWPGYLDGLVIQPRGDEIDLWYHNETKTVRITTVPSNH